MRISIIILFFATVLAVAKANAGDTAVLKPVFIKAALLYDFPESIGVTAGIDIPVSSKVKVVHKASGATKIRYRDILLCNDIGFYHNPNNYAAFMFTSFLSQRHLFTNGWYCENGLGFGILRSLYDGSVYTVDESPLVKERNYFGRFYGTAHLFLLLGYNFETSKSLPITIQLKPSMWIQYPYNSFLLPHAAFELGVKYHFKNWNSLVKQRIKEVRK